MLLRYLKRFIRGGDTPTLPTSPDTARPVSSVSAEYAFIDTVTCECAHRGTLARTEQQLAFHKGAAIDVLDLECRVCSKSYRFFFDKTYSKTADGTTWGDFIANNVAAEDLAKRFDITNVDGTSEDDF